MGVVQKSGSSMLGLILVLAVLAAIWLGLHYRAWFDAPGTYDLTEMQRTAALKSALRHGEISVFRESGEMATLKKGDIASVGNSRCIGERECYRTESKRRGRGPDRCSEFQTNLYCAYEIVDAAGNPVLAVVKTFRGGIQTVLPNPSPGDPERTFETMLTERPDARTAGAKLCQLGYCGVSFSRWKPPVVPAVVDPDGEARRRCAGVLADIAGKGKTCLELAEPASREFRDCIGGFCGPAMIALPSGHYVRGTTAAEIEALKTVFPDFSYLGRDEHPEHEVRVGYYLAIGKLEITFDEWQACADDGGCKTLPVPGDEGWGRGRRPVINVSWNDITRDYLPWLNARLALAGAGAYRLPSDAEWEYAARAGTTTRYAFGDTITPSDARYFPGPLGAPVGGTVETGSHEPNAFGLHDMHGNAAEWVEDCISSTTGTDKLPRDGTALDHDAWGDKDSCSTRGYRGGSFVSMAPLIRSAARGQATPDTRHRTMGFRVVRTLWRQP